MITYQTSFDCFNSKLALCYEKLNDMESAYTYFKKGIDSTDSNYPPNALDYMTLIKYAFLQNTFSQQIG